jgi:hypothetical protein
MSYTPVTQDRLALFLQRLGRVYRGAGRVYLVGGTTLLYSGLKVVTKGIDLTADLPAGKDANFTRALITLRNELRMAVELVSPGQFIPEPAGTALRHRFLTRTGLLDVFAYDPIATALAKLARAREADIEDVLALLRAGTLRLDDLRAGFAEIIPRVPAEALKITEADFRRKFDAFLVRAESLQAEEPDELEDQE